LVVPAVTIRGQIATSIGLFEGGGGAGGGCGAWSLPHAATKSAMSAALDMKRCHLTRYIASMYKLVAAPNMI
jgi:hypothetical protein